MDLDDSEDQNNRRKMNFIQKIGHHEQWINMEMGIFLFINDTVEKEQASTMWFWEK